MYLFMYELGGLTVIYDCPPTDQASWESSQWEDLGGFFAAGGHGFSEPARDPFLPHEDGWVFKGLLFDCGGFGFSEIGSC